MAYIRMLRHRREVEERNFLFFAEASENFFFSAACEVDFFFFQRLLLFFGL